MNTEYTQVIKNRALELNGQSVVVNLSGGQTLTGTLAYATTTGLWGGTTFPDVLTVTVSTKAHTVRLDSVTSIGQG
ncbi:hypothetical protein [Streptomyces tubercidicus]|uniref:hypothetical protein n=1 Tax=Streptomyces tubercidicus TaxID=47759 RepID=UPI0037917F17